MTEIKPIHLALKDATVLGAPFGTSADQAASDSTSLANQFATLGEKIAASYPPQNVIESANDLAEFLDSILLIDGTYGEDGQLPIEDVAQAADDAIRAAADLQNQLSRLNLADDLPTLDAVVIGVGLWCMRHEVTIYAPEPIVNALARRANDATSTQETAAAFALMQGFVMHLAPQLKSDLERSNPERPWRMLNINFAITAIRTADAAMMRYAFDQLNLALPDECAGFYAEAYTLTSQPGFPAEIRGLIETEQRRFALMH
jgi:hypothetical protein